MFIFLIHPPTLPNPDFFCMNNIKIKIFLKKVRCRLLLYCPGNGHVSPGPDNRNKVPQGYCIYPWRISGFLSRIFFHIGVKCSIRLPDRPYPSILSRHYPGKEGAIHNRGIIRYRQYRGYYRRDFL